MAKIILFLLLSTFILNITVNATRILVHNDSKDPVTVSFKSKYIAWTGTINKGKPINPGTKRRGNDVLGIKLESITINNEVYPIDATGPYFLLKILPGDSHNKINYQLYKADSRDKTGKLINESAPEQPLVQEKTPDVAALVAPMSPEEKLEAQENIAKQTTLTPDQTKDLLSKEEIITHETEKKELSNQELEKLQQQVTPPLSPRSSPLSPRITPSEQTVPEENVEQKEQGQEVSQQALMEQIRQGATLKPIPQPEKKSVSTSTETDTLQKQIERGVQLKHVEPTSKKVENQPSAKSSMAQALSEALSARRTSIEGDDEQEEEPWED